MWKFLAILAMAGVCQAAVPKMTMQQLGTADKTWLVHQKNIYELFWHVNQPHVYFQELQPIARSYRIEDNLDKFSNKNVVLELMGRWKAGMLPRGSVFSIFHPQLHEEAVCLVKVFLGANDFDTFYKTAIWARFHMNEQMYIYALAVAVQHRQDTKYMRIPPWYEVVPNFFYNNDVIQKAHQVAMGNSVGVRNETIRGVTHYYIPANYSGWYLERMTDMDTKLSYFTEDVGMNHFYFMAMHEFPYYLDDSEHNLPEHVRGEHYCWLHRQLLARYYLERLSNDLGEIENIDLHGRVEQGYHPTIQYPNGLPFPSREIGMLVPSDKQDILPYLEHIESMVYQVLDSGYVIDVDGKTHSVYTPMGLNILGNVIQGNMESPNWRYYNSLDILFRRVLGFGLDSSSKYQVVPNTLEVFLTSLRDPIFYRMYKRIYNCVLKYKINQTPYTLEELSFPGVRIESVTVDRLLTYFEHFDVMLDNALGVKTQKEAETMLIKAHQNRLTHNPFSIHISVNSDKNTKAVLRVFLGPKYDVDGHELDISENYLNFFQIDNWLFDLTSGLNKIDRKSTEFVHGMIDEMPSIDYYKMIEKAINQGESFTYSTQMYGIPHRMILPKGKTEGMYFKLFVSVTPYDETISNKDENPVVGIYHKHSLGYPLDRPVYSYNFTVPNMMFKDVMITHKPVDKAHLTV